MGSEGVPSEAGLMCSPWFLWTFTRNNAERITRQTEFKYVICGHMPNGTTNHFHSFHKTNALAGYGKQNRKVKIAALPVVLSMLFRLFLVIELVTPSGNEPRFPYRSKAF
jgi:hypothetical protein